MDNEKEIVKADKSYRRKLLLSYMVAIFVGIIVWNFAIPPLLTNLENLPNKARIETKESISHLVMLSFIPVAIYVIIFGRRVCRYKAIPYPGMKVLRDTVIVTGKKAIFRGKCLIILGVVTIFLTVVSMICTHYIVLHFKHFPLFRSVFYGTEI